jgi:hypothetical protein
MIPKNQDVDDGTIVAILSRPHIVTPWTVPFLTYSAILVYPPLLPDPHRYDRGRLPETKTVAQ